MPPKSIEVGWVSNIIWNGPQQIHKSTIIELGEARNGFQKYTVLLTAPATTTALLGFKLNWDRQPPLRSVNYLKDIRLCKQSREKQRQTPKVSAYPNPTVHGVVQVKGIPENLNKVQYILRDNQGKILTSGSKATNGGGAFGLLNFDLNRWMKQPGSYLLEISNGEYRKMMTIIKR